MMPRLLPIAALCLSLMALLPACQKDADSPDQTPVGFRGNGGRPINNNRPLPTPTTSLPPDPSASDAGMVNATPPPTPSPVVVPPRPSARDIPYGIPVPGKPGLVTNPNAPNAGPIDVHGFAPGQEVVDPETGKAFLVP